jgi:hypothetical protein
MFNVGQRVTLIRPLGGFSPGAQGIVQSVNGKIIIVFIDTDDTGAAVAPPFPMPPVNGTKFYQ